MQKDKQPKSGVTPQQIVELAVNTAPNKDLVTVLVRRGDSYPLLSLWEVGDRVYRVDVVGRGWVELSRVMK